MKRYAFVVLAVLLVVAPGREPLRADAARYTVENLGTTADGLVPTITGMNASGQVSGYVGRPDGSTRAVRYTEGHGWEYLAGLGTSDSYALGINAAGSVVGAHYNANGFLTAFRYTDSNGVQDISPLPGGYSTYASGINTNGDIVGYGDQNGLYVGFIAKPNQPIAALPALGPFVMPCGINDAGQITGSLLTSSYVQHAFRFDSAASTSLEVYGFDGVGSPSAACAIDADGRVGGQASAGGVYRAFRFVGDTSNTPENLDVFSALQSNTESTAGGTSVGWFVLADGYHAFVHTDADGTNDLNAMTDDAAAWRLMQAKAVNAGGVIVGEGTFNGQPALFRLRKVAATAPDTIAPVIRDVSATPSTIWPPDDTMVPVTVTVAATDNVDAAPVCSLTGITSTATTTGDFSITGTFSALLRATGGRTYTLTVRCSDAAGNFQDAAVPVVVPPDTTAPVIKAISATPGFIWPPNGKFVPVEVSVSAEDNVVANPTCSLSSIAGAASTEYVITGALTASVRASRDGDNVNRVYSLNVTCSDRAGNSSTAAAVVTVTKDGQSPNKLSATLR